MFIDHHLRAGLRAMGHVAATVPVVIDRPPSAPRVIVQPARPDDGSPWIDPDVHRCGCGALIPIDPAARSALPERCPRCSAPLTDGDASESVRTMPGNRATGAGDTGEWRQRRAPSGRADDRALMALDRVKAAVRAMM